MTAWQSIDDALREAEESRETHLRRDSPYTVPEFHGELLEHPCWVNGCGEEFESRAKLNGHLIERH